MEATVTNAADRNQVDQSRRADKRRRALELTDLRAVMAMASGRRVLWRLLEHCSVFESVIDTESMIYARAGKQDVGHFVLAEITAADEEALFTMMREARDSKKRDSSEREAIRMNADRDANQEREDQ